MSLNLCVIKMMMFFMNRTYELGEYICLQFTVDIYFIETYKPNVNRYFG